MDSHPSHLDHSAASVEPPVSVSHLVRTLIAYRAVILLSVVSVAIAYFLAAMLIYLFSDSERVTTQAFRLEFRGATEGKYPNNLTFSATDIVATPVLLHVFQMNHIDRFMSFADFSKSIFVLEANEAYENLARAYEAKLSDPKLGPVDRERIEREFELKRASIKKNDYSVNFTRPDDTHRIPEITARKVLTDILAVWADFAVNQQHVLEINMSILSPQIVESAPGDPADLVMSVQVLRTKVMKVLENIQRLSLQPGVSLLKTSDGLGIEDIRLRMENILRFRIEPLVGAVRASGLVTDLPGTIHFLESQLAYDQRELKSTQAYAVSLRDSIAMLDAKSSLTESNVPAHSAIDGTTSKAGTETLMPQISDTFLDRLVSLTDQAKDAQYRQRLVEEYRRSLDDVVPVQQTVDYDAHVLEEMRTGGSTAVRTNAATVTNELTQIKRDARALIVKLNEISALQARALNPTSQLTSTTAPPITRTMRTRSLSRLALFGVLVILMSLPVIVILCLLHNRVREEEEADEAVAAAPATV